MSKSLRHAGSGVAHHPGAVRTVRVAGGRRLRITLILHPLDQSAHRDDSATGGNAGVHPGARRALSRDDVARLYDPGAASVKVVRDVAAAHGLTVVGVSKVRHDVVLEGSVAALNSAFGITLRHYRHDGGKYRAHDEPVTLPPELVPIVIAVLGLDNIPVHRPHIEAGITPSATPMTPAQMQQHYSFPAVDASAHRIALIQFGGGYSDADLKGFAANHRITLPPITPVGIAGADGKKMLNLPLSATKAAAIATAWATATTFADLAKEFGADLSAFLETFEVTMDIQIAAAMGGGAAVDVYFAPPGVDGWRRAIYAALGEPIDGSGNTSPTRPAVISVSWGDNEANFGPASLRVINDALQAAARMGVLVCCASGDRGTSNVFPGVKTRGCGQVNTNFPSSSPAVLACGGTTVASGAAGSATEVSWKEAFFQTTLASGGGMSGFFPRPAFQSMISQAPVKGSWLAPGSPTDFAGRWIPDLAMNAAFSSGITVHIGGRDLPSGGTSAATPLLAALLTRVVASAKHPLAGLGAWLYSESRLMSCRDVMVGDNDVCRGTMPFYKAGQGWDPCTGWGAPDGARLIAALASSLPTPARSSRTPSSA